MRRVDALAEIIGESAGIARLRQQIEHIRKTVSMGRRPPPLLLVGETGTGKGLLARTLHRASPRGNAAFVDVNCAAIPEHLLEAELFGFERGAFTGAHQAKPGLFQTAHRGTLFLDEVALLSESLQAKLLKVLEDGSVRRLGATRAEPVDVWILTATNEDLAEARQARRFRDDLYHRLAVVSLALPALRERGPDILLLAERFLSRACADYGLPPKTLAPDARAALLSYPWPGNVRELSNVIERAALLVEGPAFSAADLALPAPAAPSSLSETIGRPALSSRDQTRAHLLEVLGQTGWNISRTAAFLGVARNTVLARMRRFGLEHPNEPRPARQPGDALAVHRARSPGIPRMPPHEETPTRWERRHLTFLRADLGLLPTAGSLPDMSRALTVLAEKVATFGGRVEEESPTALVATFGLGAVEDAPSRAALAALAVLKAGERAREVQPATPTVRIALHVGSAMVAQAGGTTQIDLDGKQAALRALEALVTHADVGAIVVSGPAMPFLERRFELAPVSIPGGAYRLTRREPTGFGLGGRPLTRFVGRAGELQIVADRVTQAERRQGQVVALVGEPGVGKSRFVYELTRWERMREWRVLGCGGVSYGTATPFLPIGDLLRRYFQIEDADAPLRVAEKVTETIVVRHRELEPSLAPLLALLDSPVDDPQWEALEPPQRRQRMLEGVKRMLVAESRIQPLLVVVEDLHWIDPQTQAVLDTLVDSLPTTRILLLVSYRPEYRHQWGSKTYYSQTRIDALPPSHARELLQWLIGDDATLDALKELLIARTEGNPFFLEESVRALVETRALVGHPGEYRAGSVATVEVPATVQAGLAARIDRLPHEAKHVLQTAAVIGKDVPFALLQPIIERPEEALRRELMDLQAAEFLYETRPLPDLEYTFKHALTQEVAYQSLATSTRQECHERIAGTLLAQFPEMAGSRAELLAHHYTEAGQDEIAIGYWHRAGEHALRNSSYIEASRHLSRGLELASKRPATPGNLSQTLAMQAALATALLPTKGYGSIEVAEAYGRAQELCERLGDTAHLFPVLYGQWASRVHRAHQEATLELGEQTLARAREVADAGARLVSERALGQSLLFTGRLARARGHLEAAVESYDLGEHGGLALQYGLDQRTAGLSHLVVTYWLLGHPDKAAACSAQALAHAEAVRHENSLAHTLVHAGTFFEQFRGNAAGVRGHARRLATLAEEGGFRMFLAWCRVLEGWADFELGAHDQGLAVMRTGIADAKASGSVLYQSYFLTLLAQCYDKADEAARAREAIEEALEFVHGYGERWYAAEAYRVKGTLLLRGGWHEGEAEDLFQEALAVAHEQHAQSLALRSALSLAALWRKRGRLDEARSLVTPIYNGFAEGFEGPDLNAARALIDGG